MSVADILKEIGEATYGKEFAENVAKHLNRDVRTAYRKIRKAWKNKEIKRYMNQDRTVVYLLHEWPYTEVDEKVVAALRARKEDGYDYSELDLNDIANDVNMPPGKIEEAAYRHGPKLGFKIGTKTIRSHRDTNAWNFEEWIRETAKAQKR